MRTYKHISQLFAARLINALSLFCLTIIITRGLGPTSFGTYSFLNSIIMTGTIFANFGLDPLMVREISIDKEKGSTYLSSVLHLKLFTSTLVIISVNLVFYLCLNDPALGNLLLFYSLVICLNSLSQTLWYHSDAYERFGLHAKLWAFSNVIKIPFILIFMLNQYQLSGVIAALLISELISFSLTIKLVKVKIGKIYQKINLIFIKNVLSQAWPVGLIFAFSAIYFRIDVVMLKMLVNDNAAGVYSAAYKVLEFSTLIPSTFCIVMLPELSAAIAENEMRFRTKMRNVLKFIAITGLVVSAIIMVFAELIINVLYGASYSMSEPSLRLLSGAIILVFLNGYFSYVALAMKKEKPMLVSLLFAAVLNVVLNFHLIPMHGPKGAAIATIMTETFILIACLFLLKQPKRKLISY